MKIVKAVNDDFTFRYDGKIIVNVNKEGSLVEDVVATVMLERFGINISVTDAPDAEPVARVAKESSSVSETVTVDSQPPSLQPDVKTDAQPDVQVDSKGETQSDPIDLTPSADEEITQ